MSTDGKINAFESPGHISVPTLSINNALLAKAQQLTGIAETSARVREGCSPLIARESTRRLAGSAALNRASEPFCVTNWMPGRFLPALPFGSTTYEPGMRRPTVCATRLHTWKRVPRVLPSTSLIDCRNNRRASLRYVSPKRSGRLTLR